MALNEAKAPVGRDPQANNSATKASMQRRDTWWIQPGLTFIVFTAFIVFASWRTFENAYFESGPYLSPFYSPRIVTEWMVFGKHFSPALFILPFPLLFRATCYYYRKAYYRAFFWDPPACAVTEVAPRKHYTGEREFPFVLQNLHRYAFYAAVVILAILWWDTLLAFNFGTPGHFVFGVHVGTLVFAANIVFLSMYTFSCHSWRHLSGGCANCFSCSSTNKVRHSVWQKVTHLNENHALWAWMSLFSVALTDLYVRSLATGLIHDIKIF